MSATYAIKTFCTEVSGHPITVHNGAKRDTVTDSVLIAQFSTDFSATAPVAGVGGITGIMFGWLAAYPRGEVS